jgi:hypothetical protein
MKAGMDQEWYRSGPMLQSPDQDLCGRDGGTRTRDLSVPNAARYQAALRPDWP